MWKSKKILRISTLLIILTTMLLITRTDAYTTSDTTNNLILVISTNWAYVGADSNHTVVANQVNIYYADGIVTLNGETILPIFVVNQGLVAASGCWYEDDGGLGDSNGPTMIQYINITNDPPNTWIYNTSPNNSWQYCLYATQTEQVSYSLTITVTPLPGLSSSSTVTAGVSETFYVYRVQGETFLPGSNPNYVKGWKWAINQPNANPYAQAEWTWPTTTLIYTPEGNGLSPAYQLDIEVFTMGNFWDNCFPWYLQNGPGVGWIVNF
jgi:hypothetical protein